MNYQPRFSLAPARSTTRARHKPVVLLTLCLGVLVAQIDTSIVNLAVARIDTDLGGGVGQTIGYVEGREAAQPFEGPTPIDAINAALVDEVFYSPYK